VEVFPLESSRLYGYFDQIDVLCCIFVITCKFSLHGVTRAGLSVKDMAGQVLCRSQCHTSTMHRDGNQFLNYMSGTSRVALKIIVNFHTTYFGSRRVVTSLKLHRIFTGILHVNMNLMPVIPEASTTFSLLTSF
jgi:hypothetical protein